MKIDAFNQFAIEYDHWFETYKTCQTIFSNPETMTAKDIVKEGYGEGAFVVISAIKQDH